MDKPVSPPDTHKPENRLAFTTEEVLSAVKALPPSKPYPHWDQLRHLSPPSGLSLEAWWQSLKLQRRLFYRTIPLQDAGGQPFQFAPVECVLQELHHIDQETGRAMSPETRDLSYVNSLMEEAITSSQLEGAATTRRVAKEMLLTQRPPRDRHERMILNNYRTMQRISELKGEALSERLVFDLHRLTTEETLDDPSAAGRFRREDEDIVVQDREGTVYHTPPPAGELPDRLAALCDFANGVTPGFFLHPVLRAVMLHFWLAFDHPFTDGNGRTARALFYWSLLRDGYEMCEYVSISRILKQARTRYARAFLYTETDDNDLTYFILYQLQVFRRAIQELHDYIARKAAQQTQAEQKWRGMAAFNPRQRALLGHALRHPDFHYTIEGHKTSHSVVYQTARTDLLTLAEQGLLEKRKTQKTWQFTPAHDLEQRLQGPP